VGVVRTALACVLLSLAAPHAGAAEMVVVLEGLESDSGEVQVDVFGKAHAATFPYAERGVLIELRARTSAVAARGAAISLGEFTPGRYALFAMHDANANGDLDLNFLGIPIESYGFSNDAKGTVGPPSFDAAAVEVKGDVPTRIVIRLAH
jgi:uncharacterized protein (DUF2141 family)